MYLMVVVLFFLLPVHAKASEICMPAVELEAAMIDWYGEHPAEETSPHVVLWLSVAEETWTLVEYNSNGSACTIEHGSGWNDGQHSVHVQAVSNR